MIFHFIAYFGIGFVLSIIFYLSILDDETKERKERKAIILALYWPVVLIAALIITLYEKVNQKSQEDKAK